MSDSPLVTIGLPVYNSERYLRQSLDSLHVPPFLQLIPAEGPGVLGSAMADSRSARRLNADAIGPVINSNTDRFGGPTASFLNANDSSWDLRPRISFMKHPRTSALPAALV